MHADGRQTAAIIRVQKAKSQLRQQVALFPNTPVYSAMPAHPAIIVADAHLGPQTDDDTSAAFQRFLAEVPKPGNHLVINGDLFDFWFEYRTVVPRGVFPILASLWDLIRRGVRVTVTGGNHDRWGGRFWKEQVGAEFHPRTVELDIAGWRALVSHGDGDIEPELLAKLVHRVIGSPLASMTFRALHPDVGFWLVRKSRRLLSRRRGNPAQTNHAALAQARKARALLEKRSDLDLVVLSHTHCACLEQISPERWYLNPGAWENGFEYAIVTEHGPELRRWGT